MLQSAKFTELEGDCTLSVSVPARTGRAISVVGAFVTSIWYSRGCRVEIKTGWL